MPCALYGANERNRYVGRRWRLPVPPLQGVRGAQRGLLPEDAAAVLRHVWARGPKDMNHAVQPRPRPLPLEIRGTLWMHPNSNSETSVLGQLLRVQTQRRVSAQATSNSEPSALVPSCPRVLVSSCPRVLVPSCPRVLVSSCPRVRSGNPVLRWNNGSEFAMNGTFVPGPLPEKKRSQNIFLNLPRKRSPTSGSDSAQLLRFRSRLLTAHTMPS